MFFGGDIMDVSVTVKNGVVKIHGIFGLLLVVVAGSVFSAPNPHPRPSNQLEGYEPFVNSSASTAEVLRKVHTFMTLTKPLGGKRKLLKQEEAEATMGAANALAYLTDSFGGQIAGQVLALILSSVTGDVRGILGNSLNLFQDDERRDRVQIFLDDISKQFLEFTGLVALTTTKRPLQQTTLYPGQIVLGSTGTGQQGQILGIQPAAASAVSVPAGGGSGTYAQSSTGLGGSYSTASGGNGYGSQTGSVGGAYAPASSGGVGTGTGGFGTINTNAELLQQLQQQQQQQPQKPVIYVLPSLAGTTSSATKDETKTTGNKVTSSSSNIGGDDDSEEERRERE